MAFKYAVTKRRGEVKPSKRHRTQCRQSKPLHRLQTVDLEVQLERALANQAREIEHRCKSIEDKKKTGLGKMRRKEGRKSPEKKTAQKKTVPPKAQCADGILFVLRLMFKEVVNALRCAFCAKLER